MDAKSSTEGKLQSGDLGAVDVIDRVDLQVDELTQLGPRRRSIERMFERQSRHGPPGWPQEVPPPDVADWQTEATAWLLDQSPPEFRLYPAVRRHPLLLVWLVAHHVHAQQEAVVRARSTARRDLSADLPPEVAPQVFDVLDREELRLRRVSRSVDLLEQAVRGKKFVPRM